MRLRVVLLSLLVAVVGLTFVSVAATQPTAAKKTVVNVTAKEFSFAVSPSKAPAGVVAFKVTNKGKLAHDFKIAGKTTPLVQPGKSTILTVTLKKGSYPYLCTVAGHAAAGMKGTFKVS